ncbi:hypothetical protein F2Q70_00025697 [Brassica cretica]|uniref:Uncharacterized protein n=1 Tax=Brassica cretica TaxID=69181 RepID=A0A8S9L9J1_BRACR|nr:hypothetical protein F2Q70_00025697 [Brassica cretica]
MWRVVQNGREEDSTGERENKEEEDKVKDNVWSTPMKVGKMQTSSSQSNTPDIQISVSKFSVLMDEKEEGEILVEDQKVTDEDMIEDNEEAEILESYLLEDNIIDQRVKEWKKLDLKKLFGVLGFKLEKE